MKIAMPLSENNEKESKISEHFGHANFVGVYNSVEDKLEIKPVAKTEGCSPIVTIENLNVNTIYCFGIGIKAIHLCNEKGIKLKTGKFKTVKEVIENIDNLEDLGEGCGH